MKKYYSLLFIPLFLTLVLTGCSAKETVKEEKPLPSVSMLINNFRSAFNERKVSFSIPYGTKIENIKVDTVNRSVIVDLSRQFSFLAFRDGNVKEIYNSVKSYFGRFAGFNFTIRSLGYPIEDFIPNYFRKNSSRYDESRIPKQGINRPAPVVEKVSRKYIPAQGLFNKNIAVAPSHGWYYSSSEGRWEWQRPRLFQSVEDLLPSSFCIPYLIPMLENAGANVFDPRERDVQTSSVVVDNDTPQDVASKSYSEKSIDKQHSWKDGNGGGFAEGEPPYPVDYNPFTKGTFRITTSDTASTASVSWIPDIPRTGEYAVYISYHASPENVSDAVYEVYHSGVKTEFKVNQQIGGSTWQYLGKFKFFAGSNPDEDKVVLINKSKESGKIVSADAVRFGGGMGVVSRAGAPSGRAKFAEGSRYYLQYAGMPADLIYNFNNDTDDYNDDKQDRSKYVNYLNGSSANDEKDKGLGIPMDLSLAFHTDAGITHDNIVVGTLALYGIKGEDNKSTFPNGVSRMASRDLADIMQTQIVNDIRAEYDPQWNRRQTMDEQPSNDRYPQQYSEVYRPNVPAVLIELLSHQNFLDMKFALDPQFRFTVARAMYKGMLKFLSVQDHFNFVVEPLPVADFSAELKNGSAVLNWKPVNDSLEPTAKPDKYIVYTRVNGGGFDNGAMFNEPHAVITNLKSGEIYSFKVTAVNNGGESFPSEILSVCDMNNGKNPALIINGFTRTAPPASVETKTFTGFLNNLDRGVPDKYNISFTGRQYDFNPASQFITNDEPGHGASYADYEGKVIAGNSFDYPFVHGQAIKACGYSFVSSSAAAVEDGSVDINKYKFVDLILGEQKTTGWQKPEEDSLKGLKYEAFPASLRNKIEEYLQSGGNIFVSGSYVGSDLFSAAPADSSGIRFAQNVLKFNWDTDHASKTGKVFSTDSLFMPKFSAFNFNVSLNDSVYAVDAPDAVTGSNGGSTILRYYDNKFGAGTAYKGKYGVVVFGFPFETVEGESSRVQLMKYIFSYLGLP